MRSRGWSGLGWGCIILYALPLARKGIFLYLASGRLLFLLLRAPAPFASSYPLRLLLPVILRQWVIHLPIHPRSAGRKCFIYVWTTTLAAAKFYLNMRG